MPNDNEKNLNDNLENVNANEEANATSTTDDIIDLDADITPKKKIIRKKVVKKDAKKKASTKKKAEPKTTKKKTEKSKTKSTKRSGAKSIEEELTKVTSVKSVEQIKRPKKIAMMLFFYSIIALAVIVFCLIKFSKPKKSNLLLEESVNYDFLTESIETTSRIIEESSSENAEELIDESQSEKAGDGTDIRDRLTELTTKSINYKTETVDEIAESETTKQAETKKQTETKKQVETTKQTETTKQAETKPWAKGTNVNEILPKYKEVIYPYAIYNQMSMDEIGIVNSTLSKDYEAIENKIFGEEISFDTKGTNGIIYLNYIYLKQYLEDYAGDARQVYEQLPVAPYYDYIMNDKFKFNRQTYTTNLSMKLDFKNAKNKGAYFEIPATITEPKGSNVSENGVNKTLVRVLKKAKVGYTESFNLSALLEVLDIECHTKHNPFFDVEEITGLSPKVINDMKESGFDVRAMIEDETFNYVLFDKKGYITGLYMLKS